VKINKERIIGYSRVCNPIKPRVIHYRLEIDLKNRQDIKTYYAEILRQSLYKFINLIGLHPNWNNITLEFNPKIDDDNDYDNDYENNKHIREVLEKEYFKLQKDNQTYNFKLSYIKLFSHKSVKTQKLLTKKSKLTRKQNNYPIISNKLTKYDKTFIISSAGINGLLYTPLQQYLMKYGYKEISDPNEKPFLLFMQEMENNKLNTAYFNTPCFIMNQFTNSKEIITNKANLYYNFKKAFPNEYFKYMAKSWSLLEFVNNSNLKKRITKDHEVFIIRPAGRGAYSGKDIRVVSNESQLENALNITKKYEKVLISKYITNPLLLDGKKFHLRVYYAVSLINGKLKGYVFDFYEPFTALKQYKKTEWDNPDIHDTHARGTEKELIWPADISNNQMKIDFKNKYNPKIKKCLDLITKLIDGQLSIYSQAENAFEVFGCDFILLDNGGVCLLEINDKVGFNFQTTKNTIRMSKLYFNSIINDILEQTIL
jgi:hypothetical protein